jgi:hypothetical protein
MGVLVDPEESLGAIAHISASLQKAVWQFAVVMPLLCNLGRKYPEKQQIDLVLAKFSRCIESRIAAKKNLNGTAEPIAP